MSTEPVRCPLQCSWPFAVRQRTVQHCGKFLTGQFYCLPFLHVVFHSQSWLANVTMFQPRGKIFVFWKSTFYNFGVSGIKYCGKRLNKRHSSLTEKEKQNNKSLKRSETCLKLIRLCCYRNQLYEIKYLPMQLTFL